MIETVFTFPGKAGDAIHQWPIAYHWARETGRQFTVWLDEQTCKIVAPLFAAQPCVEKVEFKPGVENWTCGGQPFHFDLDTKDFMGRQIYHLGLRGFPQRQLTLECWSTSKVPLEVTQEVLVADTTIVCARNVKPRVVLHGQGVCVHTRSTPGFWKFLHRIRKDLEDRFEEIVFVGSDRDREVGARTYPDWKTFDDEGDFQKLADYMGCSQLVIGCGSSVVALAGQIKVPSVRVHDPIGTHPKAIWANLQKDHLNDTEIELRKTWEAFRDRLFPLVES